MSSVGSSNRLSPVAHEALRLLVESELLEMSEFHLKREVGESLGQIKFDDSCVTRGHEAEIEELRRFDDLDEAFEAPFQAAMEELKARGVVNRVPGGQGKSPRAWLATAARKADQPLLDAHVLDLLDAGAREPNVTRAPRARNSALAERALC